MTPRPPLGERAMTSAERIQRSRWINKTEEAAIKLLDLLDEEPTNLTRKPEIPAELVQKLIPYITATTPTRSAVRKSQQTSERFLRLGNGNQVRNKQKAMKFVAHHLNAATVDKKTLKTCDWGMCHFAAYTHPAGAMISTPNRPDQEYGGADWHSNDHIILFRETEDGRCMIYVSDIEPLFALRTIGHHGVKWADIEKVAKYTEVLKTEDVICEYESVLAD